MKRWTRQHMGLIVTTAVLILLQGGGALSFRNFISARGVCNLLDDNASLGIAAVGMTFVILSGGIDLSVGSGVAFSSILMAVLVGGSFPMHPLPAMCLILMVMVGFGVAQGTLVQVYRLPPFLVTLGGMFFLRGAAFMVRMESMDLSHPVFVGLLETARFRVAKGAYLGLPVMLLVATFLAGCFLAYLTRFGRNVYAVGGNEQSAVLMGLPVGRTKILAYALNGFCMGLAGIVSAMYMQSGDPARGVGMELDVIASVVIGGTLLSGGTGHIPGTFLGVLIHGTIARLAMRGNLDSAWLRISVGLLLLVFVLMQRVLSSAGGQRDQ